MKQDLEIEMKLPTNTREKWMARRGRVDRQAKATRKGLEAMAVRPQLPIVVTLYRVSKGEADGDRAVISLAAVRDELARWAHGLPSRFPDGRVPRAPDGPNCRIRWCYGQIKTKRTGYQAARIIIEEQ